MNTLAKFSSKMDSQVLAQLRGYADSTGRTICDLLSEAVSQYLSKVEVRPTFVSAAREVLAENEELPRQLAK